MVLGSDVGSIFTIFGFGIIWEATSQFLSWPLVVIMLGTFTCHILPCSMCSLTYTVLGWSWGGSGSWCIPGGVSFIFLEENFFLDDYGYYAILIIPIHYNK